MLLAWGLTESAFQALSKDEQREMTMFWRWRHEIRRHLQQQAEMQQRGGVRA